MSAVHKPRSRNAEAQAQADDIAAMTVRLDRIREEGGLDVDQPITPDWLNTALGDKSPFRAVGTGALQVHLEKAGSVVHVRGRAHIDLVCDCSRCLEPMNVGLNTPVEVAMFPQGQEPEPGDDGEIQADDMGVSTYENDEIDLAGIVRDEVFLELPMNPLCREMCQGLCPSCGQNLNEAACSCEKPVEPTATSPWQGLSRLKLN